MNKGLKLLVFLGLVIQTFAAIPLKSNKFAARKWGDPITDIGGNLTCDPSVMAPSASVPTNVNSVRPGDIKLVMALGDSLTAANGAGAQDPLMIILQYRGLAFLAGGDKSLKEHITIPNILRQFNPNLFGQSKGIGAADVWQVAYLNAGVPGAKADDLPGQALDLVQKLQTHSEIDMQNDWKLLNIFIGGNDVCGYCRDPANNSPQKFRDNITTAVNIIKQHVPRVIVSLTTMLHLEMVRSIDRNEFFCQALHVDECKCESFSNFTNDQIAQVCTNMQKVEKAMETDGTFEADDFTFVTQPFFNEIVDPPMTKDGKVDITFFCPDCFHFAQKGHAVVASWVWQNMMEPVGSKTTKGNLSAPASPLKCPDPTCPFIRTVKNSQNCAKYMTKAKI
uniref:Lipase_GDSL domain-containing protein n=1 Tax=Panagrolaimus sp. JU765 TaxID=591449 RepID=A0AC34Q5K4_9BILA